MGVNVFKYGWGHVWVVMTLAPVMIGICYLNWYALRRLLQVKKGWKNFLLPTLYFLLLLLLGYQVLYGQPNKLAARLLKFPEEPTVNLAMYLIEMAGFYWAFAYKGLGLAAAEMMYNLVSERLAEVKGKRRDLSEERKRTHMRRWIAHFLGNLTESLTYKVRQGKASMRSFESYGVIWMFGMRMMARERDFFIPLDVELAHLERLRAIYPMADMRIQISGDTGAVCIIPLTLLTLYKNMYKHGDLNDAANSVFRVDCTVADRLTLTCWNRVAERSAWIYEHGGTGLKQMERILREQYGEAARIVYKTEDHIFFIEIEISFAYGRVQNVEAGRCQAEIKSCGTG